MATATTTKLKNTKEPAISEAAIKRAETKAIEQYLNALDANAPVQGGSRESPERLQDRIVGIDTALVDARGVKKVQLVQERLDLFVRLAKTATVKVPIEALEAQFIAIAGPWAARKGITYSALREVGVPARVLREASVPETRRRV